MENKEVLLPDAVPPVIDTSPPYLSKKRLSNIACIGLPGRTTAGACGCTRKCGVQCPWPCCDRTVRQDRPIQKKTPHQLATSNDTGRPVLAGVLAARYTNSTVDRHEVDGGGIAGPP